MTIKDTVLNKIASGQGITKSGKAQARIGDKVFHYKMVSDSSRVSYPFNISRTTLRADYEVWICGSENSFYVIPIHEMAKIYNDPSAPFNNYPGQEQLKTVDITLRTNKVKYGGKQVDFSSYKNKTLTDFIILPIASLTQSEVTARKYGSNGESEEHLNFKNLIARDGSLIGIKNICSVENDSHIFPSADRPDIVFTCGDNRFFIVEIEIENCLPGAYQAIKYKSLFCAEKGFQLNADNVITMLVARKINSTVQQFCNKYGVKTIEMPQSGGQ